MSRHPAVPALPPTEREPAHVTNNDFKTYAELVLDLVNLDLALTHIRPHQHPRHVDRNQQRDEGKAEAALGL